MRPDLRIIPIALATTLFLVSLPSELAAQWIENGTPVCTASEDQGFHAIAPDGAGGVCIAWIDARTGSPGVYAQRMDPWGVAQWAWDGVAVSSVETGTFSRPTIVSDGAGSPAVAWMDSRDGPDWDIYAQSLSASGVPQWTPNGVGICTTDSIQYYPAIISDGSGGAIVAWQDGEFDNGDIYVQRIDASGVVQWKPDGVELCGAVGDQSYPKIVPDGSGGAIATWQDERSGNYDIYITRVDASGALHWTVDGVALCTAVQEQSRPTISPDGSGGAIVTWQDFRSTTDWDVYAQRVNASGIVQWTPGGVGLCTEPENQRRPDIVSDGSGGAIIAWHDARDAISWDIYAQRLNASGAAQWMAGGVSLCGAADDQMQSKVASDGSGGAVVTWYDFRGTDQDVYTQRVDSSGSVLWSADGVAICTASGVQENPLIVSDASGGGIVVWSDDRGADTDIYALRVTASGNIGSDEVPVSTWVLIIVTIVLGSVGLRSIRKRVLSVEGAE
jgi:hypothetical protein